MDFDCFYFKFGNLFEKTDFIFTLFITKLSSGQKVEFSGPGARDTWRHVGATRGSMKDLLIFAIWQLCMLIFQHLALIIPAA